MAMSALALFLLAMLRLIPAYGQVPPSTTPIRLWWGTPIGIPKIPYKSASIGLSPCPGCQSTPGLWFFLLGKLYKPLLATVTGRWYIHALQGCAMVEPYSWQPGSVWHYGQSGQSHCYWEGSPEVYTPPKKLTTWKWWSGRWFSLSNR